MSTALELAAVAKTFTMHLQGGVRLPVVSGVELRGRCRANARARRTLRRRQIVDPEDDFRQLPLRPRAASCVRQAATQSISRAPRRARSWRCGSTLGYVSQFLRAVPRVPTLDVVAEPLVARRRRATKPRAEARPTFCARFNIPGPLWGLPPATFSGGEQQRVNIARGFLPDLPSCCSTSRPHRSTPPTARS